MAFLPVMRTGDQLETRCFVMCLKVLKRRSGSSHPCKVPFAVPSPLTAWEAFLASLTSLFGAAGVDLFCFFFLCHWPEQNTQTLMSLAVTRIQLLLDGVARSRCFFCSELWVGKICAKQGGLKDLVV